MEQNPSEPWSAGASGYQLGSSGAWIDLAEPPGADGEQCSMGAVNKHGMQTELEAALAARSFLNGIVIGSILRQQLKHHEKQEQKEDQEEPGQKRQQQVSSDSRQASPNSEDEEEEAETERNKKEQLRKNKKKSVFRSKTLGSMEVRRSFVGFDETEADEPPEKMNIEMDLENRRLSTSLLVPSSGVGKKTTRRQSHIVTSASCLDNADAKRRSWGRSRAESFCVSSSRSASKTRTELGLSRNSSRSASPNPNGSSPCSAAAAVEKLRHSFNKGLKQHFGSNSRKKSDGTVTATRKSSRGPDFDGDISESEEAAADDGSYAQGMQIAPASAAAVASGQQWMQVPMLASSPYCLSLEGWSGQDLSGLCLEAEVPYSAAAFFGLAQYQSYNPSVHPTQAHATGICGQDVFPYGGLDNSAYQAAPDYATAAPASEDAQTQGVPGSESIAGWEDAAYGREDAFESEGNALHVPGSSEYHEGAAAPMEPISEPSLPASMATGPARRSVIKPNPAPSSPRRSKSRPQPRGAAAATPRSPATSRTQRLQTTQRGPTAISTPAATATPRSPGKQRGTGTAAKLQSEKVSDVARAGGSTDDTSGTIGTIGKEKPSTSSPAGRSRRLPTIAAKPVAEDVFIYHLSASSMHSASANLALDGTGLLEGEISENVDIDDEGDGSRNAPNVEDRMAEARFRSNKLLSGLSPRAMEHSSNRRIQGITHLFSAAGSPRKAALAPLDHKMQASDSARSMATTATHSTPPGSSPQWPSQRGRGPLPLEAAKEAQRRRIRERRWDGSFAMGVAGDDLDSASAGHTSAGHMTWGHSQEMAANWAVSLATNHKRPNSVPGLAANIHRSTTNASGGAVESPVSLGMLSYKPPSQDVSRDYVEWHGSPLHKEFLRSLEAHIQTEEGGVPGAACALAIDEQMQGTHVDLRNLLLDSASSSRLQRHSAEWFDYCQKLVDVLVMELQAPDKFRQAYPRSPEAVSDHAKEMLAFRDTTVRIIGALVERELVLLGCENGDDLEKRPSDDPVILHLSHISKTLTLSISSWCRRFGHLSQLTCEQLAGASGPHGGYGMPMQCASVFVWCGHDALAKLQVSSSHSPPPVADWLTASSGSLGQTPGFETESTHFGGRLPGLRTEERATRSGTRSLRALLRGGQGAAGQYMSGKFAAQKLRPGTTANSSLFDC